MNSIEHDNKKNLKNRNWKKYIFEFLSIFIAVISAFMLNNWNDMRKENQAESRILEEISHGLDKDIEDVELNVRGHEFGLRASHFWRKVITDEEVQFDSLHSYYFNFLRDFISIQNTSGYENLKSRGFELVNNDSLRSAIIALYEYDYKTLKTFEEDYFEMQFHENYFKEFNDYISPNLQFDEKGDIISVRQPLNLSAKDKNKLISYLWKIDANRNYTLSFYKQIETNIKALKKMIDDEQGG